MGELFRAYASLSKTLNLGLTGDQLMRAEGTYKNMLLQRSNPNQASKGEQFVTENYEFKVSVQQRAKPMTMAELSKLAQAAAFQV